MSGRSPFPNMCIDARGQTQTHRHTQTHTDTHRQTQTRTRAHTRTHTATHLKVVILEHLEQYIAASRFQELRNVLLPGHRLQSKARHWSIAQQKSATPLNLCALFSTKTRLACTYPPCAERKTKSPRSCKSNARIDSQCLKREADPRHTARQTHGQKLCAATNTHTHAYARMHTLTHTLTRTHLELTKDETKR